MSQGLIFVLTGLPYVCSDDSMPPEKKAKMESMNGSGDPNTTTAATTNASSHDAYNYSNVPWAGQYVRIFCYFYSWHILNYQVAFFEILASFFILYI